MHGNMLHRRMSTVASWRSPDSRGRLSPREPLQRRALFCDQLPNLFHEIGGGHVLSLLFPASADVDLAGLSLFISDHEQEWHFLHGMFADLGVHLFVARIDGNAHSDGLELIGDFVCILRMALADGD